MNSINIMIWRYKNDLAQASRLCLSTLWKHERDARAIEGYGEQCQNCFVINQ